MQISYQARRKRECEMAELVLQCRGPVGLGQEQEFPVQTWSLLEETGEPAPQKSICSLPPRKTYTTGTHKHGNMNILKCVFFPRIHSALISLGGQEKLGKSLLPNA